MTVTGEIGSSSDVGDTFLSGVDGFPLAFHGELSGVGWSFTNVSAWSNSAPIESKWMEIIQLQYPALSLTESVSLLVEGTIEFFSISRVLLLTFFHFRVEKAPFFL